ncbi:hypothetical protein ABZ297_06895 [Nonomuraea sp. NPDC005983]|uniref:hypothetical protein n=1 Tax=Nonomuraea sp. NPDC005983 TaxID=3155595 RepID=UPI00339E33C5
MKVAFACSDILGPTRSSRSSSRLPGSPVTASMKVSVLTTNASYEAILAAVSSAPSGPASE